MQHMQCVSSDSVGVAIRQGDLIFATAVSGANILRDMREAIANIFGGKMKHYERVLEQTIARALETLKKRAKDRGYDGIVSLRISHPHITDGTIEVVVYGTGFFYMDESINRLDR